MDRIELLKNGCFAEAPGACRSLSRWDQRPGWLGGALSFQSVAEFEGGEFFLTSRQAPAVRVRWQFPFLLRTKLDGEPTPLANASVSRCLHAGDHVALKIEGRAADGAFLVGDVLWLAPSSGPANVRLDSDWPVFLGEIRKFLVKQGLTEVQTPSLVPCPGLEPALEPFATELRAGSQTNTFYLPTSPEIFLKKALCSGLTDIFEIKTCFRNGEVSAHHQPEFHMLEWYRAYADLEVVVDDIRALMRFLKAPDIRVTTFRELFRERLNLNLQPNSKPAEMFEWCRSLGLNPREDDTKTDLFHRIWIDKIEPGIAEPTIVRDFPPEQAALARIKVDGWADRFEFYWNGLEIANAFNEVNDPEMQLERWRGEQAERRRLGRSELDVDVDLLSRMRAHGMPPTGGIAMGLERLYMAATRAKDIRSLRLFPYGGGE